MIKNETKEYLPFKKEDQRKLRDLTKKISAVISHIETDDITQTNRLCIDAALWIAKEVGVRKSKNEEKKETERKLRTDSDITNCKEDKS